MKTNDKATRRLVLSEAWKTMRLPILLLAVSEALGSTLLVETANALGRFAQAALSLDWSLSKKNAALLALYVALTLLAAPLFNLLGNISTLKGALEHEKLVFGRFFQKSPEAVRAIDSGELRHELEWAANNMRKAMVRLLNAAFALPVCLGWLLYCAGRISWLLTAVMLALAAVRVFVPALCQKTLGRYDREETQYCRSRRSCEMDVTGAPYLIRLWGISAPVLDRFFPLFRAYYKKTGARYDALGALEEQYGLLVGTFTRVLLFTVGAAFVAKGRVTAGELIAVLVYLGAAQTIFENVAGIFKNYPLMMNHTARVCDFYRDPEQARTLAAERFAGLRAEGLCLSFAEQEVLRNVCFSVARGGKVAVVGENGSGKSTLGRIMATLLIGYTGEVSVNGTELRELDPASWRARIAYAPQDAYLFQTTVRENVMMGNPAADEATVEKMMTALGVAELADREIDEESDLSGGERQKISLLRALIKDAEVLILDEPTNHLDKESIAWLTEYLTRTEQTVIVITHDETLIAAMRSVVEIQAAL